MHNRAVEAGNNNAMDCYTARVPRFCVEYHADDTVEVFVHASLGLDQRYAHMARLLHMIAKDDASWRVVNVARVTASGVLQLLPDAIVRDDGHSGSARLSQLAHTVPNLFAEGLHARFRLVPRTVLAARDDDAAPMLVGGPMVWTDTGRALYELERLRLLLSDADKAECYCTVQVGRHMAEHVTGTELRGTFDRLRAQWATDDDGMRNSVAGMQVVVFVQGLPLAVHPEPTHDTPTLSPMYCSRDHEATAQDQTPCAIVFDDDGNASPVRRQPTPSSNPVKDIYARTDRSHFFNVKPVPVATDSVSASAAELRQLIVRARKDNPDADDRNAALFEYAQVRLRNSMTVSNDPVSRGARDVYKASAPLRPPTAVVPQAPCSRDDDDPINALMAQQQPAQSDPVTSALAGAAVTEDNDDSMLLGDEQTKSAVAVFMDNDANDDAVSTADVKAIYDGKPRCFPDEYRHMQPRFVGEGTNDHDSHIETTADEQDESPPPPPPDSPTLADMIRSLQRQPCAVRVEDCNDDDDGDENDDGWSSS